jgi:hypothetical protein
MKIKETISEEPLPQVIRARRLAKLTRIAPNFDTALVAHFREELSSMCLDNDEERLNVARSVIKFSNNNLKTRAGVWK